MTRRSDPVQEGPPPDPIDLAAFPCAPELPTTWFREHARRGGTDAGCWWFSSHAAGEEPEGRFDLTSPHGTCYLGETPGVAVRERCGRFLAARLPIPATHTQGRIVSEATVVLISRLAADLTSPAAARFGVTGELAGGNDYEISAAWAEAFYAASFEAILYQPRFTPAVSARSHGSPTRARNETGLRSTTPPTWSTLSPTWATESPRSRRSPRWTSTTTHGRKRRRSPSRPSES